MNEKSHVWDRLALLALWPLLLLGMAYTVLRYPFAALLSPNKALRMATAIDEAANVAINGYGDTTISARAARARNAGRRWGCVLCRLLDMLDKGHCDRMLEG